MRKTLMSVAAMLLLQIPASADPGMWIPMFLKKYNIETMQQKGFKLTADDIYNINQASLKDAVIGLGREDRPFAHFCTGEIVSDQGLMLTNHHCAFGMIQSHSSLEKNYIRDGFWAMDKKQELSNPGITASILQRMEDVTSLMMEVVKPTMTEVEREAALKQRAKELEEKATKGTNLSANIKPFFDGNQYIMAVYKVFKDVRLVGAPPAAIGKFGGDTDNWVWPRHTGDFSVLRIYADKNNEPASYSASNVPYNPKRFFKVSTKGINPKDFTMVFGYPGTTNQYATSFEIDQTINKDYPARIAIRTAKLDEIKKAMQQDELVRIKYSAKAASVANAWKKWQGEVKGVTRFKTIANKQAFENEFQQWSEGKDQYAIILPKYKKLYAEREQYVVPFAYATEAGVRGAEAISFVGTIEKAMKAKQDAKALEAAATKFFKNFDYDVDLNMFKSLVALYKENTSEQWQPAFMMKDINKLKSEAEKGYAKSIFSSNDRFNKWLALSEKGRQKQFENDPLFGYYDQFAELINEKIAPALNENQQKIDQLNKPWMAGIMAMKPNKNYFPDANSTLRVSYGAIEGYKPKNAVAYTHFTTLTGIMEKDSPAIYDYNVPQRLRDLYKAKDFGAYTQAGDVPVCFVASNHTTGGNSGSPVLNSNGALIGINFDRAWDGVMSDIDFQPEICRNIAVDIRYVLFIMDKFAGAKHLVDEMVIED